MLQYARRVFRRGAGQGAVHGIRHPLGNLLPLAESAALPHLLLLIGIQQKVRRLIAGGTAQSQHAEILAQAMAELKAHLVPVVGGEFAQMLVDLRRAGQHQQHPRKAAIRIPGEEHVNAVILVAANVSEVVASRLAVHLTLAAGIDGVAIVPHHSVAEGTTQNAVLA